MARMHDGVAFAARDEPAIERERRNAATPAMAREKMRLPQKGRLVGPASIAPGIIRMMALSTISMTVIDAVSAATSFSAEPTLIPMAQPVRQCSVAEPRCD